MCMLLLIPSLVLSWPQFNLERLVNIVFSIAYGDFLPWAYLSASKQTMALDMLATIFKPSVPSCTSYIRLESHIVEGQGIVERAHQTLQHQLKKLKRGSLYAITPNNLLSHALFVLNFLSLDKNGKSAAQHLWHYDNKTVRPMVKWKDPIEGRWYGPDPVLIWGRGHVCVFPRNAERLVRMAEAIAGGTN